MRRSDSSSISAALLLLTKRPSTGDRSAARPFAVSLKPPITPLRTVSSSSTIMSASRSWCLKISMLSRWYCAARFATTLTRLTADITSAPAVANRLSTLAPAVSAAMVIFRRLLIL